jgi:hypothetical protein
MMIEFLEPGMRVMLPSGNVVVLIYRERTEWLCRYTTYSRARGEVVFSSVWLRKHGMRV